MTKYDVGQNKNAKIDSPLKVVKENIKCNIFKLNIYVLIYFKHFYPTRNEKYALTNIIQPTFLKKFINYHLGFQNTDFPHT